MATSVQCDDPTPHYFHSHKKIIVHQCSGKTACGDYVHPPHGYDGLDELWCPGICDCGDSMRGPHGPGDHK